MLSIFKDIFGSKHTKDQQEFEPYVKKTNEVYVTLSGLSDAELRDRSQALRKTIADFIKEEEDLVKKLREESKNEGTPLDKQEEIFKQIDDTLGKIDKKIEEVLEKSLPEAFAIVKETARRLKENGQLTVPATDFDHEVSQKTDAVTIEGDKAVWHNEWSAAGTTVKWDMVHYDVQIIGGAVLHKGKIAEMATGEGKTLVATLPVFLNALADKGVHLVTVNDYLARRDCEWMAPIFQFHLLTVDCIDNHQPNSEERRQAYKANITYGTNNEFGFDYLRDNMVSDEDQLVQGKHHFAIIDEVDSVLIDDARTPLIISGPTADGDKQEYVNLKPRVEKLVSAQKKLVQDLLVQAKKGLEPITRGESVDKKVLKEASDALLKAHRGFPKNKALIKFLSEPGIKTQLQKTENEYRKDHQNLFKPIDKDLYFVIEEKMNSVELADMGVELLSDGGEKDQFVLPDIAVGLDKIEKEATSPEEATRLKDELLRDYTVKSEKIHSLNQLLKAYSMFENEVDYVIMDGKVKIVDEQTGRIMEGRRYSDGLHQAIEAKENVKVEAATQTYATISLQNYFRMYHKLGGMTGTAETEAKELWDIYELDVVVIPTNRPIARKDEHDMIYKTAREKYNAIAEHIGELVAQGRPVLVGTTTVENSELISRLLQMRKIQHQVLNAKYHQREAEIVAQAGIAGNVTIATNMAGRGTDIKLGEGVKEAGGLAIVGTERHESRRVDRQLRGRAGRQGDPGSSQFFVSLEDNLMRLFGSERISKWMDRMGLKEGEVIQHKMVSRSIERAQKKIEEINFGQRKNLLEYDDVMNKQRKAIYRKRLNAVNGERLDIDIADTFYELSAMVAERYVVNKDFRSFETDLFSNLGISSPVSEQEFESVLLQDLTDKIYAATQQHYHDKTEMLRKSAAPVVEQVYENERDKYKNMVFPITDGLKTMRVIVNLEEAYNDKGASLVKSIEKNVVLGLIDNEWKDHLRDMDNLRQNVRATVGYEQKDPLLVYKLESFKLFQDMLAKLNQETGQFLMTCGLPGQMERAAKATSEEHEASHYGKSVASRPGSQAQSQTPPPQFRGSEGYDQALAGSQEQSRPKVTAPIKSDKQFGRNDRVKLRNVATGETKEMKYKQAESLLASGQWAVEGKA